MYGAPWLLDLPSLVQGQWAIDLMQESVRCAKYIPEKTRYSLVTRAEEDCTSSKQNGTCQAIGMEKSLSETSGHVTRGVKQERQLLIAYRDEKGKGIVSMCSGREVHETLPELEKEVAPFRHVTEHPSNDHLLQKLIRKSGGFGSLE